MTTGLGSGDCQFLFGLFSKNNENTTMDYFPIPAPSMKEIDDMVTRDMSKLSVQEREIALHDVHGIVDPEMSNESPQRVASSLDALERELARIKKGTAYELAEHKSKEYVANPSFRLTFLRADLFNEKDAAQRMIRYFHEKLPLFGEEKLTKDIVLEDLDEEDMKTMQSGYAQVLPGKDRSGRKIIAIMTGLRYFRELKNVLRTHYYVFHSVMEDEDAQKNGVVVLFYHVDVFTNDRRVIFQTAKLKHSIPIKLASIHMCYNEPKLRPFLEVALTAINSYERVRYRSHYGSHLECIYKLLTFGIFQVPATPSGELLTMEHSKWLENRRWLEQSRQKTAVKNIAKSSLSSPTNGKTQKDVKRESTLQVPGPNDVLFGRGKPIRDNAGNVRFRHIVNRCMNEYNNSERLEKGRLTAAILRIVKSSNGRFLKRGREGGWEEVDDVTAREKVHHTFRNLRNQKL